MKMMMRIPILIAAILATTLAAQAQIAPLPVPSTIPPPPAPSAPPPPKIEVPEVPKMDAPPKSPKASESRRSSFNDRVITCLDDPYAARLAPGERATYSRGCANRTN
jgi:hypothetical protein